MRARAITQGLRAPAAAVAAYRTATATLYRARWARAEGPARLATAATGQRGLTLPGRVPRERCELCSRCAEQSQRGARQASASATRGISRSSVEMQLGR